MATKKFLLIKSCLNYIWDGNSLAKESIREGGNNNFVIQCQLKLKICLNSFILQIVCVLSFYLHRILYQSDEDKLMKKLKRSIKTLPESYLTIFSEKYKIDKKVVEKSLKWVYNVSDIKLQMNLAACLKSLRKALGK